MAAHALTGLTQLIHSCTSRPDDRFWPQLKAALELSCWTEDLPTGGWLRFMNLVEQHDAGNRFADKTAVKHAALEMIAHAAITWEFLGYPRDRERWRKELMRLYQYNRTAYNRHLTKIDATLRDLTKPLPCPVPGVVSLNSLGEEFLDLLTYHAIDLAWEEHLTECDLDDHDDCGMEEAHGTQLVGDWKKNDDPAGEAYGLWDTDTDGKVGFAVTFSPNTNYVTVLWSRQQTWAYKCSPCYPGQGDLDTLITPDEVEGDCEGDIYWSYTLHSTFWRANNEEKNDDR